MRPAILALLLACASQAAAAPDDVLVESTALCFKLRFPGQPEVWHFEADYGTGWCRAHHYVVRRGKGKAEQCWEVMVLQHADLRLAPDKALERLLAGDTGRGEEVLSQSAREHAGRRELRARFRTPATDRSPQETRALYTIAHGLVYILKYECVPAQPEGGDPWERFEAGLELIAPAVSQDWVPHLSGRGGFCALFPAVPSAEREVEIEVGGRPVTGVEVAAADAGRWELVASAYPWPQVAVGKRGRAAKEDAAARDGALDAARRRALEGLADPVLERDAVLRPGCRELVVTGRANGVRASRIVRITLGEEALVMARATAFGVEPPRAILEGFVAAARPVPRFDGKLLEIASPDAAISGATLGTGEKLRGSSGSYAKSGRYTHDIHTSDMTMPRAEFRASDAEYLRQPALGSGYSALWKLHRTREVALGDGAGFARSYFTRDGDDVIAIYERVTTDAEGYECHSTLIRNRAVDPKHLEHLFRPGK